MIRLVLALAAAIGTDLVLRQTRSERVSVNWHQLRTTASGRITAAGPALGAAAAGLAFGQVVFGSVPLVMGCAVACGALPSAADRRRRSTRATLAREAWPAIIDEIRVLTGSAGRSVPHALFEAGIAAPRPLHQAFVAGRHEWLITTDFDRAVSVVKDLLMDPAADAVLETLLVAHEVGGGGLDHRLHAVAEDRRRDLEARRDALAEQAGVRFARRFVLIVPAGMALVGLQIGPGQASYHSPGGQVAAFVGIATIVACWMWSGAIMRLPEPGRVLTR